MPSVKLDSLLVGEVIQSGIVLVRGLRVMLSHDLAALYGVETKVLVQTIKRNVERFPIDFMFQLTDQEVRILKSQFVTSSWGGARRANPYAFTEQGVAMLSGVLRSERAIAVNIEIMRTFVKLRSMLEGNKELAKKLGALERKYDEQFKIVFEAIRQLMTPTPPKKKRPIGFVVSED
jgi:hypothetical protein